VKNRWKLGDMGLIRSSRRRRSGPLQGSLTFLAPETLRHEFSPANDIYSLGVTVLLALTGRYAHSGESRDEFVHNLRNEPPTIPTDLDEPWNSLLWRCLQSDPARRLTAEQIENFLRAESIGLPPLPDARTIVVAADGSGEFSSIQEAIEAAHAGSRIVVRP